MISTLFKIIDIKPRNLKQTDTTIWIESKILST